MIDGFDKLATLEELWRWRQTNRKSAWRFPEKWEVQGYYGTLPIGIVADEPGKRSLAHLDLGLPYANDVDIFTHYTDERLYELLKKYKLGNAHLMDTHISFFRDREQDERVFLKQLEIVKLDALHIMDINKSKRRAGPWRAVEGYLNKWKGPQPRLYPIYHYS